MSFLDELQSAVTSTIKTVGPSVVGIGGRFAAGTGVVIGKDRILTNAHNIRTEEVTVTFSDGRTAPGRPLGVDVDGDVAVLQADTRDAPAIAWPDGAPPGVGAPVFALADPGGAGLRVTFGLVTGTSRAFRGPRGHRITGSLEHSAPLLPGSSGGPIVSADGTLLGINTNRLGEGFYLAIPADAGLRDRAETLSRGEKPERRKLGVGIAPVRVAKRMRAAVGLPEADGVLIRHVEDDSPAAAAGLQEGDLITKAGERAVADSDDLLEAVASAGDTIQLTILRGVEERTVSVRLAKE